MIYIKKSKIFFKNILTYIVHFDIINYKIDLVLR